METGVLTWRNLDILAGLDEQYCPFDNSDLPVPSSPSRGRITLERTRAPVDIVSESLKVRLEVLSIERSLS
jgi:hypothetical protein